MTTDQTQTVAGYNVDGAADALKTIKLKLAEKTNDGLIIVHKIMFYFSLHRPASWLTPWYGWW